jgi:arylsulfatase A-like enzyme
MSQAPRTFPILPALLVLAALGAASACSVSSSDPRPSIVLVVIDTLRADAVSAYGSVEGTTPTLDALAAEGLLYRRAYAPSPWTVPSHASLFSGLGIEGHRTGMAGQTSLPERFVTLAERLQQAGYQTAAFSENMSVSDALQLLQGFEHRRASKVIRKSDDVALDDYWTLDLEPDLAKWLSHRDRTRPFFLFVNLFGPHAPYTVREENPWVAAGASPEEMRRYAEKPHNLLCGELPSKRDLEILRGLYLGDVAAADAQLKTALELVNKDEKSRDVVAVITSDHGESFGEGRLMGHEFGLRNAALHIPLVVHGLPGLTPGIVETPVTLVDVTTSILEWANVQRPPELVGRPLPIGPAVERAEQRALRAAYSDSLRIQPKEWEGMLRGVDRMAPRKTCGPEDKVYGGMASLIEYPFKFHWFERYDPELYDLSWDPAEGSDLAPHRPELVDRFTRELEGFVQAAGVLDGASDEKPSAEAIEALRALGYIDGG